MDVSAMESSEEAISASSAFMMDEFMRDECSRNKNFQRMECTMLPTTMNIRIRYVHHLSAKFDK
jgi:hypothetical protein